MDLLRPHNEIVVIGGDYDDLFTIPFADLDPDDSFARYNLHGCHESLSCYKNIRAYLHITDITVNIKTAFAYLDLLAKTELFKLKYEFINNEFIDIHIRGVSGKHALCVWQAVRFISTILGCFLVSGTIFCASTNLFWSSLMKSSTSDPINRFIR